MPKPLATIILAAGQGTRMKSELPKVLHEISGDPMVSYPIRLSLALKSTKTVLVIGHGGEQVREYVEGAFPKAVNFQTQEEQNGTGHAVKIGMKGLRGHSGRVLILYGDVPLLTASTIAAMNKKMNQKRLSVCITTMKLQDPTGYGRIVRDEDGAVVKVVEQKDGTAEELAIDEVNAGIYLVDGEFLKRALKRLRNNNAQKEYYLTDIVGLAVKDELKVDTLIVDNGWEVQGANNRAQLAELEGYLRSSVNEAHMTAGVSIINPSQTYIGPRVKIGKDTVIQPNVHIRGDTVIGKGCRIDTGAVITDAKLGNRVTVNPHTVIEEGTLRNNATVGPFARIRPGADIMDGARVGNFVELKKTTLGRGAKANHLAYLGDTEIGPKANIGAGTITCNYDGHGKHKTVIGGGVFVGSNSTLVAPVSIDKGAYVAAGSTITDEVGPNDLAFGRARQTNKAGRAKAVRKAAQAAAAKKKG